MAAFHRRGWTTELVVCDNNSTDGTARIARAAGAVVVFEPVNQISRARNAGAAAASGDWFIFVDADSRPTAELCADTADAIESGRVLAGGCTLRMDERFFWVDVVTSGWNGLSRMTGWVAGAFIFCSAGAFREIGGFNEQFYVAEELDLSKRLKMLARKRQQTMVILTRHPLETSARKARLYGPGTIVRFFLMALFSPRRTLIHRDLCRPSYAGHP